MEIIEQEKYKPCGHRNIDGYFTAILIIVVGLVFLGRNLGWVSPQLFRILISWKMLLIVLGVWSILKQHYFGGIVLMAVGLFFLMPQITCMGGDWLSTYWPLAIVIFGIFILLKRKRKTSKKKFQTDNYVSYSSEDGFLNSENVFGGIRHIILDPVFKGGVVKGTFAGTVIDLRRTTLGAEQTYIDVDCTFSGVEIFAPNDWLIVSELKPVVGGFNDKRYQASGNVDNSRRLIIRGKVTFGGVEVKS